MAFVRVSATQAINTALIRTITENADGTVTLAFDATHLMVLPAGARLQIRALLGYNPAGPDPQPNWNPSPVMPK